jgi:ribose 5-phosphate isomerase
LRVGALLREKIVACARARMVTVVDETKLVDCLGTRAPLPVEIVSFGWQVTLDRLGDSGATPTLRRAGGKSPSSPTAATISLIAPFQVSPTRPPCRRDRRR